jgi:hypothetical protein
VAAGGALGAGLANLVDWASNLIFNDSTQTPDQQALGEIVRDQTKGGRVPLTNGQADTVLDWGKEVGVKGVRDNRGASHWRPGGTPTPHIHVPGSGVRHIPVDVTKP